MTDENKLPSGRALTSEDLASLREYLEKIEAVPKLDVIHPTDEEYEQIKDSLPEIGSGRRKLVTWLTEQHNEWTKEAAAKYPKLCAWGRPLDEQAANGSTWASVENYFYCELLTYSTATLQWCKRDFEACLEAGENPVISSVLTYIAGRYGYSNLEDIEAALAKITPNNLT